MTTDTPGRAVPLSPGIGGASLCDRLLYLAEDLEDAGFRSLAEQLIGLTYRLLDAPSEPAPAAESLRT
ncbi:MAG: hypothetical protein HIU82_19970 [Proteobacteria bacterium]|nr:hypothetical protein [Pseudomonadota bacterium]